MKLIKDNIITEQKDDFIIEIYKNSGWVELEEKTEVKKTDDKKEPTKTKKNK